MYKPRLDALADGIFAIVMTLLVIEIKVPELDHATNAELWHELKKEAPLFLSYILSFIVLGSYWMAHNFIISIFSKNLTRNLAYLNIPFFMSVALIPFSSHFLGSYNDTQIGITIYGLNVTIIGLILFALLRYTVKSKKIENQDVSRKDIHFGYIRILLPPISSLIAIPISFFNTRAALVIFVIVVLFNFVPGGLTLIDRLTSKDAKTRTEG